MSEQESRSPDGDGPDILSRSQQNELRQSTAPARSQFSRAAEGGESDTGAGSEPADSLQVLQAQLASAEGTIQELRAELAGLKQPQTAGVVSAANECAFLEAEGTIQALRSERDQAQQAQARLIEYVQHKDNCMALACECNYGRDVHHLNKACRQFKPRPCTCGLDTARRRDARHPETQQEETKKT